MFIEAQAWGVKVGVHGAFRFKATALLSFPFYLSLGLLSYLRSTAQPAQAPPMPAGPDKLRKPWLD